MPDEGAFSADTPSAPARQPEVGFYARNTTGLVRGINLNAAIALNVSFMGVAYAVLVATEEPYAFPGGNAWVTAAITAVLCIFPALLYGMFTIIMPRSGGDYTFISRTLHPWLGFAANCNVTSWYLVNTAYLAYLVPKLGLSSAMATLGVAGHSSTLTHWSSVVTTRNWSFGIALVTLLLVWLAVSVSLPRTLQIMRIVFGLSILGVLIGIVILAFHTAGDFHTAVAHYGGNYGKVIADARRSGYTYPASGVHFSATMLAAPLAFAAFGYGIVTAYTGGEIRSASKTAVKGMLYSLLIAGALTAVLLALAQRVFGSAFLGSATALSTSGSSAYPFKVPSFVFFYISMLISNRFLIAVIGISFIAAAIATIPPSFLATTRSIFAWSFDRVIPTRVSEVSGKRNTPFVANAIILAFAVAYLVFIAYGPAYFLNVLFTILLGQVLTFMVTSVAGIVFPYRRRTLYRESPITGSFLGLPVLTVVSIAALIVYGFFGYSLATTSALGANTKTGLIGLAVIVVLSAAIYPVSWLVQRARGLDLNLAFRQLPPE